MSDPLADFYRETGLQPLHPTWAKWEILLGLLAIGIALLFGREIAQGLNPEAMGWAGLAPLTLFVLGSYLAMAGQRSLLYQSNNRLVAYLAVVIRSQHSDGDRS